MDRCSGRPLPALQGLDPFGCVVFSGSFSNVLFPSRRLAYFVVPVDLVERFAAAQSITNHHAPLLEHAVLADFIAEGHFARHVSRMRQDYAERLSVPLESARGDPSWRRRARHRARGTAPGEAPEEAPVERIPETGK